MIKVEIPTITDNDWASILTIYAYYIELENMTKEKLELLVKCETKHTHKISQSQSSRLSINLRENEIQLGELLSKMTLVHHGVAILGA